MVKYFRILEIKFDKLKEDGVCYYFFVKCGLVDILIVLYYLRWNFYLFDIGIRKIV